MSDDKTRVVCIGSAGRDIFFPTGDGDVVEQGEQQSPQWCFVHGAKVHIEDRFQAPGGCACNVSVGLARLGVASGAYGVLGADADGDWIRGLLEEDHVDTSCFEVMEGQNSDLSVILVDKGSGERTIFSNRDVGEYLKITHDKVVSHDWAYVGSMYGDGATHNMEVLHDALVKEEIKLAFNPGMHNIEGQPRLVWNLIHHAHMIFVNKVEAQKIVSLNVPSYNEEEFETEVGLLNIFAQQAQDDAVIVLTRGGAGAWACKDGVVYRSEAQEQRVVDTTGAGDAFASGFVAAQLVDKDVITSLKWGAANSHNVIAHYGAQEGLLTTEEIKQQHAQFDVHALAEEEK